jgi:3,4-dihydroxy 2-butanone 4-phosphate synthase/GTP cyclohydrolase II
VLLGEPQQPETTLARLREQPEPAMGKTGTLAQWRRTGAGSQILADLGLSRLRVLGSPRRQVGVAGFGLEISEYVALPPR